MRRIIFGILDFLLVVVGLALAWSIHGQLAPDGEIEAQTPHILAPYLLPLAKADIEAGALFVVLIVVRFTLAGLLGRREADGDLVTGSAISLSNIDPKGKDRIERVGKKLTRRACAASVQISNLVDDMFVCADFLRASDLHIEPKEEVARIWLRIDGVMEDVASIPKEREHAVMNRLRVLSNLPITQTDTPQDGRIEGKIRGKNMNLRISIFPTLYGSKAVVRLLDAGDDSLPLLSALGIEPDVLKRFRRLIHAPQGIILFTGPTGSGKTTLMYSAMKEMLTAEQTRRNIVTLEDPIERAVPSINQTQIERTRGLSFATALRTILRQDPNVIMVGEIRDAETAEIALRAGQTGHLILTTLHTNSAAASFGRLVDMGIAPFLLASAITGVVGIRLVRKVCPNCREAKEPSEAYLSQLPIRVPPGFKSWEGAGCEVCQNTGFAGRTLVFELLEMNDAVAKTVLENKSAADVQRAAQTTGMVPLLHDGLTKAWNGTTSLAELLRVVS